MKRRRRTEILIQENSGLAQHFAEAIIQNYPYQEVVAPQYGLTMIKKRESAKNSLFFLGEVLVTEAKVEINRCIGIGIVAGMNDELAKHLAIIDAAYKAQLPETEEWHQELVEAEQCILQEKVQVQAELFETKVDFETMDV